jgi:hypothetical protein
MTTAAHQPVQHQAPADRLAASLRRCSFLLNTARLVITDREARDIAAGAVAEARAALKAYEAAKGQA